MSLYRHLKEGCKEHRDSLFFFSGAQEWDKRQWAQRGMQEVPIEHQETIFHSMGDRALPKVDPRLWGVLLGRSSKPTFT